MSEPRSVLWAASLYGYQTKTGRVDLYKAIEGTDQPAWHEQLSIDEARTFAFSILQAAEAAETDEVLMTWLRDEVKVSGGAALGKMLAAFRRIRDARRS